MSDGQLRASAAPSAVLERDRRRVTLGIGWTRLAAIGASAACASVALYLWGARDDASKVGTARALLDEGRYAAAAQHAGAAPGDARAALIQAYALRDAGRERDAVAAFARASAADPDNWIVRRDWAVLLAQLGQRDAAARQMAAALRLNPRLVLPAGFNRG
jgi:Flp pilus assembly protein TadD